MSLVTAYQYTFMPNLIKPVSLDKCLISLIFTGVIPDLPEHIVKIKSRLEPGKMFLVDFEKGDIVSDNVIKEEIAHKRDYSSWLHKNRSHTICIHQITHW